MAESTPPNQRSPSPPEIQGLFSSDQVDIVGPAVGSDRQPPTVRHMSSPAYESPVRHHRRHESKPRREVKETLNAKSQYSTSEDDGTAQHRINQYVIKQEIGRGSFGAVHLATDQYGNEYAVKEFSKSRLRKRAQSNLLRRPKGLRRPNTHMAAGQGFNSPLHRHGSADEGDDHAFDLIKEEIAVMKKLNHPNVVSLIEVLDDPDEDSLYMVLEMCKKGVVMNVGLDNKADPYDDETCRLYFRDMILGMEYLHAQGIIHRDIKPDNCLVTADNTLKIVDFGVSEMFEKASAMQTAKSAGSPAFMPPELCVAKHGEVSGRKADIWSMGVTLYCLKFGQIPFEKEAMLELYDSIRNDVLRLPDSLDESFKDVLERTLQKDPEKRISMDELREHPWITKDGADPLVSKAENTADLIEPPTEEELNTAITGNMKRLLMKAARRFRRKLLSRRPELMQSIFGGSSRFVQPPGAIHPDHPLVVQRSKSSDVDDRRPIEGALTAEGIHCDIEVPEDLDGSPRDTGATAPTSDPAGGAATLPPQPSATDEEHTPAAPRHTKSLPPEHGPGKGQAHDPLEDTLFLHIGNGDESSAVSSETDVPVVCESPGAVSINVYEQAYQEEIDRILQEREGGKQQQPEQQQQQPQPQPEQLQEPAQEQQGQAQRPRRPTLFLTRRVEDVERIRDNVHLCAMEHKETMRSASDYGRAGLAGLVAKAKSKARDARDEHDKRKQERTQGAGATTTAPATLTSTAATAAAAAAAAAASAAAAAASAATATEPETPT